MLSLPTDGLSTTLERERLFEDGLDASAFVE
jgi:hypothetical protein